MKDMRPRVWMAGRGWVCAMVLAAWVLFAGAARADEALGYIPAEMNIVGVIDVQTLYAHEQMALVRDWIKGEQGVGAEILKGMNISFENLNRIVFGLVAEGKEGTPDMVVVFEMKEDVDEAGLNAIFANPDAMPKRLVGDHTVYTSPNAGLDSAIPTPKHILLTSPRLTEAVLVRTKPIAGNEVMMAVADLPARDETVWAAILVAGELFGAETDEIPEIMQDLQGVLLTASVGTELTLGAVGTFSKRESAEAGMGLMQLAIPVFLMHAPKYGIDRMPELTVEGPAAKISLSVPINTMERIIVEVMRYFSASTLTTGDRDRIADAKRNAVKTDARRVVKLEGMNYKDTPPDGEERTIVLDFHIQLEPTERERKEGIRLQEADWERIEAAVKTLQPDIVEELISHTRQQPTDILATPKGKRELENHIRDFINTRLGALELGLETEGADIPRVTRVLIPRFFMQ